MHKEIEIGTILQLKQHCLHNEKGKIGVCFDMYYLDGKEHPGFSVILENGEYSGFSDDEIETYFTKLYNTSFKYNFSNVMNLCKDFDNGLFKKVFEKGKLLQKSNRSFNIYSSFY